MMEFNSLFLKEIYIRKEKNIDVFREKNKAFVLADHGIFSELMLKIMIEEEASVCLVFWDVKNETLYRAMIKNSDDMTRFKYVHEIQSL